MMSELPNYDAWKEGAFDPPSMRHGNHPYAEDPPECPECGETMGEDRCDHCGYVVPDEEPDPDAAREREMDEKLMDRDEPGWRWLRRAAALAGIASVLVPASASAGQLWFYDRSVVPDGSVQEVTTRGKLTLGLRGVGIKGVQLKCTSSGTSTFYNGLETGFDEVRSMDFACSSESCVPTVHAVGLPGWPSVLSPEGAPPNTYTDTWQNVALEASCGAYAGTFSGTLAPITGDSKDEQSPTKDEPDIFVFFPPKGPRLPCTEGCAVPSASLSFLGFDKLGANGAGMTAYSSAFAGFTIARSVSELRHERTEARSERAREGGA